MDKGSLSYIICLVIGSAVGYGLACLVNWSNQRSSGTKTLVLFARLIISLVPIAIGIIIMKKTGARIEGQLILLALAICIVQQVFIKTRRKETNNVDG